MDSSTAESRDALSKVRESCLSSDDHKSATMLMSIFRSIEHQDEHVVHEMLRAIFLPADGARQRACLQRAISMISVLEPGECRKFLFCMPNECCAFEKVAYHLDPYRVALHRTLERMGMLERPHATNGEGESEGESQGECGSESVDLLAHSAARTLAVADRRVSPSNTPRSQSPGASEQQGSVSWPTLV